MLLVFLKLHLKGKYRVAYSKVDDRKDHNKDKHDGSQCGEEPDKAAEEFPAVEGLWALGDWLGLLDLLNLVGILELGDLLDLWEQVGALALVGLLSLEVNWAGLEDLDQGHTDALVEVRGWRGAWGWDLARHCD